MRERKTDLDFFKEADAFSGVRSTRNCLLTHISNSQSCISFLSTLTRKKKARDLYDSIYLSINQSASFSFFYINKEKYLTNKSPILLLDHIGRTFTNMGLAVTRREWSSFGLQKQYKNFRKRFWYCTLINLVSFL